MSGLQKATLSEITSSKNATTIDNPIVVQFNPASLKLNLSNTVEGGKSRTQQVRQFTGKSSTELSFDLVFDTADEISEAGTARSVRERTAAIERFVIPKQSGTNKASPPKVRFEWGGLVIDGVISSLNIDFELFSPEGVPLRAKMSVSIQEQDSKYMFLDPSGGDTRGAGGSTALSEASTGAGGSALNTPDAIDAVSGGRGTAASAAAPGQPGTVGGGSANRTATAIGGESLAEFAARQGLDPAAWRALASQVTDSLSLPAGFELSFDPALNTGALGASARPEATAPATVEEALGIAAGSAATLAGGLALAAAGGPTAAAAAAEASKAEVAVARERRAFAAPGASEGAQPAQEATAAATGAALVLTPVEPARTPLRQCSEPIVLCVTPVEPSAPRVQPYTDPRTITYGLGVPLRARVRTAVDERTSVLQGAVSLRTRDRVSDAVVPRDPTAPPWEQLPLADAGRTRADRQVMKQRVSLCGCSHSTTKGGGKCQCTSGK